MKQKLILALEILVLALVILFFVISPNIEKDKGTAIPTSAPVSAENDKDAPITNSEELEDGEKATFMYFVTNDDLKDKKLQKSIEALKEEYAGKVSFDIKNVDENKELLNNFPVEGATPAVIMLKPNGDIVNILFKTSDFEALENVILSAFEG